MGGSSKKQVVGYKYYASVHIAVCQGPVDSLNKIFIGERLAWSGNATANTTLNINKPELFGGKKREGGVVGPVDLMFGESDQPINANLALSLGASGSVAGDVVYEMFITSIPFTVYVVKRTTQDVASGSPPVTVTLVTTESKSIAESYFVRNETTRVTTTMGVTIITTGAPLGNMPAFRGLFSVFFRTFLWSSRNPYFKAPWFDVTRILKGWRGGSAWYPEKAVILSTDNVKDMNPIHAVYQIITDDRVGMGYSTDDIDDANFRAAADKIYAEGFGLSGAVTESMTAADFVKMIEMHINARLRLNLRTGKFEIYLIRDDYDIDDLVELNVDNAEITSFQRMTWGETANRLIVMYTGRNEKPRTLSIDNLAGINAQGGVTAITREYPYIRDPVLARRVAQRDLLPVSSPLAKVSLKCNRVLSDKAEGDLFKLNWEPEGIFNVAFRIIKINKGNLLSGEITVDAVEDVFGLQDSTYLEVPEEGWVDPIQEAADAEFRKVIEAPYWEVVRNVSEADRATLPEDYGFAQALVNYGGGLSENMELMTSPTVTIDDYETLGYYNYTPHAQAMYDYPAERESTVSITVDYQLDDVEIGDYCWWEDEACIILALDTINGVITLDRGTLDTVPVAHAAGSSIWFAENLADDPTIYVDGETVYYRALTQTPIGALDINDASQMSVTMGGRAQRPYPPGNVTLNGSYFPVETFGDSLNLSWAHRHRTQQTASLVPFDASSIGPEPGTTYSWELTRVDTAAVLASDSGISGTSAAITSTYRGDVKLELWSVRDGLDSFQRQTLYFTQYGEKRITEVGSNERVTETGAFRTLEI